MSSSPTVSANNKRIAKNTLMLYVKMGVMMLVTLYTSRVVLQTLGVDDFGIYNVVGGVVVLFSFLNSAMSSATQRFLNFELGKKDLTQVARVFSMSMSVHFCIAGVVLVLAETIGLWFLNTQLNIPAERMAAANWVYQFSVASTLLGILLVPYNATIIAYERMVFYAWSSIVKALLLLGIVYLLVLGNADKLILYAGSVLGVNALMQIIYIIYCRHSFPQTSVYRPFRDKKLFGELISFSGWSLFGGVAVVGNSQGINMLMNVFCGVAVNAAMGITYQVSGAITQFVASFQTAFKPQLVKSYASNDLERFISLMFRTSKYSFFLMFVLVLPVCLNIDFILGFWLGTVPKFTTAFVRLALVYFLVSAVSNPLQASILATGRIRKYEVVRGGLVLSVLPIAYVALKLGFSPVWIWVFKIIVNVIVLMWGAFYLRKEVCISLWRFFKSVVLRVLGVGGIASVLSIKISDLIPFEGTWFCLGATTLSTLFLCAVIILGVGLDKAERSFLRTEAGKGVNFLRRFFHVS